jgi:hypothetical protein
MGVPRGFREDMARQGALAAIALLLSACQSGPSSKQAGGGLEISVEVESLGASPREGDLATLVFRVTNGGENAVILKDLTQPRDLMLAGSSAAVVTWQFSQAGLLSYSPDKDEWTYEKGRRADTRRPVFNSGLLVSKETLVVRARVRLLDMPVDFQFSYFELTKEDLRRKVYFEDREQKILRYRTLIGRDLDNHLVPTLRTDEAGHRFVIFPHAEPIGSVALLKTFRLQQPLRPRYFTLEQAARKAGVPKPRAGDYTFSTVFDAWILPKDQGHVLVTPASLMPLPELCQMERTFHLIDSTAPEKLTIELRAHSAATALGELKYPIVKQEKKVPVTRDVSETRTTYYLFLPAEQLSRLFTDLRTLKLNLDIEYGDGGGSLIVHNK